MPGINRSGRPTPLNHYLGRGAVELALIDDITGKPRDFRQVGNATAFSLNVESEKLDHRNSRSGVRTVDREIILEQKVGVTLTMDEATDFDNVALFLSGEAEGSVANPALGLTATGLAVEVTSGLKKGRSYNLVDADGNRLMDVRGTIVIKTGTIAGGYGSSTTLSALQYEIDRVWGTVFFPEGSTATAGHGVWLDYTTSTDEAPIDQVTMLTKTKQSAFLRFKAINPANSDVKLLVELHSVSLSADGDFSLIGEEFTELTLTGVAERNEVGFPDAPTGRIYYHANAI